MASSHPRGNSLPIQSANDWGLVYLKIEEIKYDQNRKKKNQYYIENQGNINNTFLIHYNILLH